MPRFLASGRVGSPEAPGNRDTLVQSALRIYSAERRRVAAAARLPTPNLT